MKFFPLPLERRSTALLAELSIRVVDLVSLALGIEATVMGVPVERPFKISLRIWVVSRIGLRLVASRFRLDPLPKMEGLGLLGASCGALTGPAEPREFLKNSLTDLTESHRMEPR